MSSKMWNISSQAAYENPYYYIDQAQFIEEGKLLLKEIFPEIDKFNMSYKLEDLSFKKAVWMLCLEAHNNLVECLNLLQERRHRIVPVLFRDITETIDLAEYFHSNSKESNKHLDKWYQNKIIPNSICREYFQQSYEDSYAKEKKNFYSSLSKFTHKSYKTLCQSYCIGRNNYITHDSHSKDCLILPQTIAQYMPVLANMLKNYTDKIVRLEISRQEIVDKAWATALK